ncbi:4051_t:CDS:2 [Paraglomus brasilianum]|uniref:4051_t:CDS:1 n=1 Tax=Paraglomus brasilianum TaxID=144538 RepID=A0A9N8Z261_9GLOM|nr:4051_t:CDS:2 [Paraglomus brasilianum]
MYLYVGEKNNNSGREIKIGIEKNEYENSGGSKYDNPHERLEAQQAERLGKEENRNFTLAEARAEVIRKELDENKNIKFCSDKCQHYLSKKAPNEPVQEQNSPTPISPKTGGAGKAASNKNNQISDTEKSQILQYFINKSIKKITINNGKLVIEYNNSTTKTIENKDQQLQKYYQLIQTLPNQSLSLSELQENKTNNPTSTPNRDNTGVYVGLTIGAFILGGTFVYFLARKKKK